MKTMKKTMLKAQIIMLITFCSILLTSCGSQKSITTTSNAGSKVSSKTTIKKHQRSYSKITPQKAVWDKNKEKQLAEFMHNWQNEMRQEYDGTYDQKIPDHLGIKFPDSITSGELNRIAMWLNEPVHFSWGMTHNRTNIAVLAAATGGPEKKVWPRTYLFCLHNNRPVVLTTATTNGDKVYFSDTQNSALQDGFRKIVTSESVHPKSNHDLNQDIKSSLDQTPQQFPSAYQGNWYWYDQSEHQVQHYSLNETSGLALNYYETSTPQWVNLKGDHQMAGAGDDYYLRYRYYDGQQIPVMMNASGAGQWFDFNSYQSPELAQKFQSFKFLDEPSGRDNQLESCVPHDKIPSRSTNRFTADCGNL